MTPWSYQKEGKSAPPVCSLGFLQGNHVNQFLLSIFKTMTVILVPAYHVLAGVPLRYSVLKMPIVVSHSFCDASTIRSAGRLITNYTGCDGAWITSQQTGN